MKKALSTIAFGTIFVTLFSSSIVSAQSDSDNGSRSVGGQNVSYSHFLTYDDVECGMNTQAHYHADTSPSMDLLGVDWSVTSVTSGNVVDSGGITHKNRGVLRDESNNLLPINVSTANYEMNNGGSTWTPTSKAYHCEKWPKSQKTQEESADETDKEKLKEMYSQIQQDSKSTKEIDSDIQSTIENQLSDNAANVEEYTFEDGSKVSLNDFKVSNVDANNDTNPVADEVTFNNPQEDNATIIELEVEEPVFKDDNKYELTGYVTFVNNKDQNLESGIYSDLVE